MAAVFEYGISQVSHKQMHPFFQHGSKNPSPSRNAVSSDVHSNALDGTSEHDVETSTQNLPPTSSVEHGQSELTSSPLLENQSLRECEQAGIVGSAENMIVDLNEDRRKRRKLTPLPEPQTNPELNYESLQTVQRHGTETHTKDEAEKEDSPILSTGRVVVGREPTIQSNPEPPKDVLDKTIASNPLEHDHVSPSTATEPMNAQTLPHTPKRQKLQPSPKNKSASPRNSNKKSRSGGTSKRISRKVEMKNGKFVQSLRVVLSYAQGKGSKREIGKKIEDIMTQPNQSEPVNSQSQVKNPPERRIKAETQKQSKEISKIPHPFFLGKVAPRAESIRSATTRESTPMRQDSDEENGKVVKPWKDIVFGTKNHQHHHPSSIPLKNPLWPPLDTQRVQPDHQYQFSNASMNVVNTASKSKQPSSTIPIDEDILHKFASAMRSNNENSPIQIPEQMNLSSDKLIDILQTELSAFPKHTAIANLWDRVSKTRSAFDRGVAAGPLMWTQEYAPKCWQEVLQPNCQQLYDWLKKLTVHHVQSGDVSSSSLKPARPKSLKKRTKKSAGELDDFIVSSEDELSAEVASVKNSILICGPSGCGKTASVHAVAQQLGFEVFEIHPGMRRSSKDIHDKVGDMTQNHLVQHSNQSNKSLTLTVEAVDSQNEQQDVNSGKQLTMAQMMGQSKKKLQSKEKSSSKAKLLENIKSKLQKQSLILLEEVDILFEDDKSFWTGVQSLLLQSKRPVIMTCNDPTTLPMEELDFHTVLDYQPPSENLATEYLTLLAAAEGHLLQPEAVNNLYLSKGHDLRATITELNFWCQMTVGSRKGGLDWLPCNYNDSLPITMQSRRTISKGTYFRTLDLVPEKTLEYEELWKFAQYQLHLAPIVENALDKINLGDLEKFSNIQSLDQVCAITEGSSVLDTSDQGVAPLLSWAINGIMSPQSGSQAKDIFQAYLHPKDKLQLSKARIQTAFDPLMEDHRSFPPTQPRTAPSLDSFTNSIPVDIAPYVRSIALFDQRLESYRDELSGGKRVRKTRTARAALEGGNKAMTRREKWFPKDLNYDQVMNTGGDWPQLQLEAEFISSQLTPSSTQSTMMED